MIDVKLENPSLNNTACSGWKLLGELELPAGSRAEERMKAWLVEVLRPLDLQEDFLDRMLRSARAVGVERLAEAGPVHLLVYAPPGLPEGQSWGFFRIEKAWNKSLSRHSIEFYLYLEGP